MTVGILWISGQKLSISPIERRDLAAQHLFFMEKKRACELLPPYLQLSEAQDMWRGNFIKAIDSPE